VAARVLVVLALALAVGAGTAAAKPYENPRLPVRERVADLLKRMTLEEKAGSLLVAVDGRRIDNSLASYCDAMQLAGGPRAVTLSVLRPGAGRASAVRLATAG
jgi:hypothetical protein